MLKTSSKLTILQKNHIVENLQSIFPKEKRNFPILYWPVL